jgi:hypothetical protein
MGRCDGFLLTSRKTPTTCCTTLLERLCGAATSAATAIEIEIVYNMYRMRRFFTNSRMRRLLSLGPPNYAIHGTYKSRLDRYHLNPTSPRVFGGFTSPRGGVQDGVRVACI